MGIERAERVQAATCDTGLGSAIARCRAGFVAVFAFSAVVNLLMLTVPVYMLQLVDRVLSSRSLETLVYLTLVAAGALAFLGLFELLRSRILVRLGTWLDAALSPEVFKRCLENALAGASYGTDSLRDLATLRGFLGGAGIMALFDTPWVPAYLAVIFLLHPLLGIVALVGSLLLFGLAFGTDRLTRRPFAQASAASARALRGAESAVRNAEILDGMGMASTLAGRWSDENDRVLAYQSSASDRAGLVAATTKAFRLFLQVVILAAGAWLVVENRLTAGGMIAASIILSRALAPVEQALGAWRHLRAAGEAWQRLSSLLDRPSRRPPAMVLPPPRGHLVADRITYTSRGAAQPILSNVSLEVPPGEVLALVGPSAAGKSTLARLLVGLDTPQSGVVRLDGADVFAWEREDFGLHVGYLPQDVELFAGTVRENIARMQVGEPSAVVEAARLAGVHEVILALPHGYETGIGENGAALSGGQRQRIALARALYGKPALLVLDEPNASLDTDGERALSAAIATLKQRGATIVLITHRPSLMAHVDRIVVLREGRVHLAGGRQQVLAQLRAPALEATA